MAVLASSRKQKGADVTQAQKRTANQRVVLPTASVKSCKAAQRVLCGTIAIRVLEVCLAMRIQKSAHSRFFQLQALRR